MNPKEQTLIKEDRTTISRDLNTEKIDQTEEIDMEMGHMARDTIEGTAQGP